MYIGLHVKCRLFLSDFIQIWIFIDGFSKKFSNAKLHENPSSGTRDFAGGRAGRRDEANTAF